MRPWRNLRHTASSLVAEEEMQELINEIAGNVADGCGMGKKGQERSESDQNMEG